jgi:hypothetical protein
MATTAVLELQLKPDSLETAHTVIHATLTGPVRSPAAWTSRSWSTATIRPT